jgi:peptidyl-dipeptidase Dcp
MNAAHHDTEKNNDNPLLIPWNTPFDLPPFSLIDESDYLPAFRVAMDQQNDEIHQIITTDSPANFDNTIRAFQDSGRLLANTSLVFALYCDANTNERLQDISRTLAPLRSEHQDAIRMNPRLFARVEAVYNRRTELELSAEQHRLLELTLRDFVRGGARLSSSDQRKLTDIHRRLALLALDFSDHLLAENNRFELRITRETELSGLPEALRNAARKTAADRGQDGWTFTLHKPSWLPFMQYADHREHRRTMMTAFSRRGAQPDALDNRPVIVEMVRLRMERARLLGCESHADDVLEPTMAGSSKAVMDLLAQLWQPALDAARREADALQSRMRGLGMDAPLEDADWYYLAEKQRIAEHDLDDNALRPYFELERMQACAFEVAGRLFDLQFCRADHLPIYHPDVIPFAVRRRNGEFVGILYVDYYPRAGKQQGAFMTHLRHQEIRDGQFVHPVVVNVFNFPAPTEDTPALLNLEEVRTLFHEFGHALHGLLSRVTFRYLAGTRVPRDFVEFPSQFMENWATTPEILQSHARHYRTGEPIPATLIDRIQSSSRFNQGFATVEYLAAAFLDMAWHTQTDPERCADVEEFERTQMARLHLLPQIPPRYRSPYFAHIFSGGYAAGYYSYIWSEVLDSDAFDAFRSQPNLFDRKTAKSFEDAILATGNTALPMELYRRFRGRAPLIEPLLRKRGLIS